MARPVPTSDYCPVPLPDYREWPVAEMRARAAEFYDFMRKRHTVRDFSPRPVPRDIIEQCLLAALATERRQSPALALRRDRRFQHQANGSAKPRRRREAGLL